MQKLLYIFIFFSIFGCKTQSITTTKTHSINDTIIYEKSETIQLPVNYTYTLKTPCKNDSLIIANQSLEIGDLKLKIRNLNGQLVLDVDTDTIINSKEKETSKHTEKQVEVTEKVIIKTKWPKFLWYLLGGVLIYIAYRVARIYFPIIRFLPY